MGQKKRQSNNRSRVSRLSAWIGRITTVSVRVDVAALLILAKCVVDCL